MNQGAVLGLRRGHFQRVPASSHWLWARLEGGSLKIQLPHRDAWALGLCTTSTGRGDMCVCPCLPQQRRQGQMGGGSQVSLLSLQLLFPLFQNLNSSLRYIYF